jgi:ABC-2 type transport system permease protein
METRLAPTIAEPAALYRALIGARIRSQWEYRTSFLIDAAASFAISFVDFMAVLVLFRHFPALESWSLQEVAFLYGTAGVGFAIADLFVGHIEQIGQLIRLGTFDTILVRPAGSLLQIVAHDFALRRLGKCLQAAIVLVYALGAAGIDWNVTRVAMTGVQIVSAAVIFSALFIFWSCAQFWVIGIGEIANGFTYGGNYVSNYPFSILGPWLRRLLTYVIPLAFVAYFPSMYVLGRDDAPIAYQLVGPLVAAVALLIASRAWAFAVRHYRSTGS